VVGVDQQVPLLDGRLIPYVNLDNAASTPPFREVTETLDRLMPYYSSVHRGTGFKSRVCTTAYDQAHEIIAQFVGANPESNTVIFGKNTTEAINKLSYRLPLKDDSVIIATQLEHHSNDLPWRHQAEVVHVKATREGRLDEEDFDRQLSRYGGRVALVAVTGASNVTGYLQPVHRLARKAHAAGTKILVDAAQLAPHRQVNMKADNDPEHLDFVALSAHKMYAPFGAGALIGPTAMFQQGAPEYRGGGTVDVVTLEEVSWAGMPDRDEAGSPNVLGAVAMARAAQVLMQIGMDNVARHEEELTAYALGRLSQLPFVQLFGETDPDRMGERVGAIPFNLEGMSQFLVAAILGYEGGIGVRSGCFCAHPYVVHLLQLSEWESKKWREEILEGDKSDMPGLIRASLGCYNNSDDIDRLVEMLERINGGDYQGEYRQIRSTGEFVPVDYEEPLSEHFLLDSSNLVAG
jgi:cysteine desulfurase/selenocysteine lyase